MAQVTKLESEFERVGLSKIDMRAFSWARDFIADGGSRERWLAAFDKAAEKLRSEGQLPSAQARPAVAAPASQPNNGAGLHHSANTGRINDARPVARPPHKPSAAVRTFLANTVLDKYKTSDGRAWGDVSVHELHSMKRDGTIAKAILREIGTLPNKGQTVREALGPQGPKTFEAIWNKATKE